MFILRARCCCCFFLLGVGGGTCPGQHGKDLPFRVASIDSPRYSDAPAPRRASIEHAFSPLFSHGRPKYAGGLLACLLACWLAGWLAGLLGGGYGGGWGWEGDGVVGWW